MGRWKRVYSSSRTSESGSEYLWSTKSYALKDLSTKFKFPLISRCDIVTGSVSFLEFDFDLKQPLLLHTVHETRKLLVRSVKPGGAGGGWEDAGPHLIIPERYDGWFQIITDAEIPKLRLKTLQEVIDSPHRTFLTTLECSGVQVVDDGEGGKLVHGVKVGAGDIIERVDVVSSPDVESELIIPDSKYVRFCDEHDEEFLVQYDQKVSLYPIKHPYSDKSSAGGDEIHDEIEPDTTILYSPRSIVNSKFAEKAFLRQIYGDPPNVPCINTGILRVDSVISNETVLVSTLDSNNPLPLELAVNSNIRFSIALNWTELRQGDVCQSAIGACESHGDQYLCKMKVAFTLTPEVTYAKDDDNSFYSESEVGEDTDANSEFDINWEPDEHGVIRKGSKHRTSQDKYSNKPKTNDKQEVELPVIPVEPLVIDLRDNNDINDSRSSNNSINERISVFESDGLETQDVSLNVPNSSESEEGQDSQETPADHVLQLLDCASADDREQNQEDVDEGCFV